MNATGTTFNPDELEDAPIVITDTGCNADATPVEPATESERECDDAVFNEDSVSSDEVPSHCQESEYPPREASVAPSTLNSRQKRVSVRNDGLFFRVFVMAVVLDQITKALAVFLLGFPRNGLSFGAFLGDYFSRIQEFPWRIGENGYKQAVDVIDGFLRWQLTTNTGAAFSIFSDHPGKLAIVSAVLITFLYILFLKYGRGSDLWPISFGLQIGGAFGNFIDRARLGEVVDFVAVKVPSVINGKFVMADFPIFNVADACAVVGTISIGLMFIIRDVSQSYAARRARFELDGLKSFSGGDSSSAHALDHDRYSAFVVRIEKAAAEIEINDSIAGEDAIGVYLSSGDFDAVQGDSEHAEHIIDAGETPYNIAGHEE